MRKITISFALLFLIFGCKKTIQESVDQVSQFNLKVETVGEIHNRLLNQIALSPGFPTINQKECFQIISKGLNNENVSSLASVYDKTCDALTKTGYKPKEEVFGKYNSEIMSDLFSSRSSVEFFSKADVIEAKISKDNTLSQVESSHFKNTLSILKNSFSYWISAINDENHPWHQMVKYKKTNIYAKESVAPNCWAGTTDIYAFAACIAMVDTQAYDDAFWYIYNGNNFTYSNNQATAEGTYQSGRAMDLGMILP